MEDRGEIQTVRKKILPVMEPQMISTPHGPIEVSVHQCPRKMRQDVAVVLRSAREETLKATGVDILKSLLIVPTCQQAQVNLVNYGAEEAAQKDMLLERFAAWASATCDALSEQGFWADFCDPASGLPMRSKGNAIYPEVQGLTMLRNYPILNVGACKLVLHPTWGSAVYPATLFTNAPPAVLLDVMGANPAISEAKLMA
jgi:hypothetical protein